MDIKGKKVLVCGMARSGIAAAKLLIERGAIVTVQDKKDSIEGFDLPGCEQYFGRNPDEIVENFDLIVISPGIPIQLPFIKKAKAANIPVWGEMELATHYTSCPIIAITGTNGKTTVTTLLGEIMRRHNPKTIVGGNIGTPLTEIINEITPDHIIVAEVSSFQLETIDKFRPQVSAVLNMTPDHLDRHGDMPTYIAMKERIFENQTSADFTVLNLDNAITAAMRPPSQVVYFSATRELEKGVFLKNNKIYAADDTIEEIADISGLTIHPENALAAAALAICAKAPVSAIAEGLREFKGVEHRVEYVDTIGGIKFYNDSKATNVDAAIKGLEAISGEIVLIGGGYDKKADFTDWVKKFHGKVRHLILIGATAEAIADTCKKHGFTAFTHAHSLEEAVAIAITHAKAKPENNPNSANKTKQIDATNSTNNATNDEFFPSILLSPACASFGMFDNFEHRGYIYKQIISNLH